MRPAAAARAHHRRPPTASGQWHLELDLVEAAGVTTLTFAQRLHDPALARDVGPGWEYYLDRLVAAQAGADVAAVAWPDYERMSTYYEPLFTDPS